MTTESELHDDELVIDIRVYPHDDDDGFAFGFVSNLTDASVARVLIDVLHSLVGSDEAIADELTDTRDEAIAVLDHYRTVGRELDEDEL